MDSTEKVVIAVIFIVGLLSVVFIFNFQADAGQAGKLRSQMRPCTTAAYAACIDARNNPTCASLTTMNWCDTYTVKGVVYCPFTVKYCDCCGGDPGKAECSFKYCPDPDAEKSKSKKSGLEIPKTFITKN